MGTKCSYMQILHHLYGLHLGFCWPWGSWNQLALVSIMNDHMYHQCWLRAEREGFQTIWSSCLYIFIESHYFLRTRSRQWLAVNYHTQWSWARVCWLDKWVMPSVNKAHTIKHESRIFINCQEQSSLNKIGQQAIFRVRHWARNCCLNWGWIFLMVFSSTVLHSRACAMGGPCYSLIGYLVTYGEHMFIGWAGVYKYSSQLLKKQITQCNTVNLWPIHPLLWLPFLTPKTSTIQCSTRMWHLEPWNVDNSANEELNFEL